MQRELAREEQLKRLQERYAGRAKEGRGRLLDEFCEQYGYSRKHAIKLLKNTLPPSGGQPKPGPEPRYESVQEAVEHI